LRSGDRKCVQMSDVTSLYVGDCQARCTSLYHAVRSDDSNARHSAPLRSASARSTAGHELLLLAANGPRSRSFDASPGGTSYHSEQQAGALTNGLTDV
jgi:hypothetical protein